MKYLYSPLLACLLVMSPVSAEAKKKPALTPMELQSIQSKEFETTKQTLFASTMSVFQDLGYIITSADVETGFITAISATTNKTNFLEAMGGFTSSGNTKATAFIEGFPNGRARIRLNFVNTKQSSSAYGQNISQDKPILEVTPYRVAWDKIDEALFVRGVLSKPAPEAAPVATPTAQ